MEQNGAEHRQGREGPLIDSEMNGQKLEWATLVGQGGLGKSSCSRVLVTCFLLLLPKLPSLQTPPSCAPLFAFRTECPPLLSEFQFLPHLPPLGFSMTNTVYLLGLLSASLDCAQETGARQRKRYT